MPIWNSFSFIVWYLIPLTALVFIYSRISHLLWTSDSNRQSSRQSHGILFYFKFFLFGGFRGRQVRLQAYVQAWQKVVWKYISINLKFSESNGSLERGNGYANTAQPGSSWQMKNGRIVVYKQESLLNVPKREKKVKEPKRPKDTEGRRKVNWFLISLAVYKTWKS